MKLPILVPIGGNGSNARLSKAPPPNTGLISPAASSSGSNAPGSPTNARMSSGERMSTAVMSSSFSGVTPGSVRSMRPSCGPLVLDHRDGIAVLRHGQRGAGASRRRAPALPRRPRRRSPPLAPGSPPPHRCRRPAPPRAAAGVGVSMPKRPSSKARRSSSSRGGGSSGSVGRSWTGRRGSTPRKGGSRICAAAGMGASTSPTPTNAAKPNVTQTNFRSPAKGAPMRITRHANAVHVGSTLGCVGLTVCLVCRSER